MSLLTKSFCDVLGYLFGTILKCISWGIGIALAIRFFLFVLFCY
jgi:hypothetical protein